MSELDKLPLIRVVEVAFPTTKLADCPQFYRQIGLVFNEDPDIKEIQFTDVGEQFFGFAHQNRGFMTGYGEEMIKSPLHVAFEIPADKIDDCISFLNSRASNAARRSNSQRDGMEPKNQPVFTSWIPLGT